MDNGTIVAICAVNAGRGHRYELQSDQIKHGSKKRHRGMRIQEYGRGSKRCMCVGVDNRRTKNEKGKVI